MNYITRNIFIDQNDQNGKEYIILIGKNAQGNEEIIKQSNQNDLWFHFQNVSSCHVILQSNGDPIPKRYINQVAGILFEYTTAPKNSKVIYTCVKNVKLTSVIGTVIPSNIKIIKF